MKSQRSWRAHMDFWVYILRCSDGSYYIGHTDKGDDRLKEHEIGRFFVHPEAAAGDAGLVGSIWDARRSIGGGTAAKRVVAGQEGGADQGKLVASSAVV